MNVARHSYITHLEAAIDGSEFEPGSIQTTHRGRPLWVRYDLERIAREVDREVLRSRPATLWRYEELLPLETGQEIVTLGERTTPLLPCPALGRKLGVPRLQIKDESLLPTGSFKSRGQALAVTMAKHFGVRRLAIPTAGNAGGAMAAYAARAGLEAFVFMPRDTPSINRFECLLAGAKTRLVDGLIGDCGRIVRERSEEMGWFDLSTLKEPYRLEGKKTMGLELAEQLGWHLPDVIIYPTGGGTGLIGMWKAFQELKAVGWLDSKTMPRMVAAQSDGCCPIVDAFERGERFAETHVAPATIATGLRVPSAIGDFMILDALHESQGRAVKVEEKRILPYMKKAVSAEGLAICPETATCLIAAEMLATSGWIHPDEHVVIFNTGAAQKYPEVLSSDLLQLERPEDQVNGTRR